jgi:predicted ABC-type transport system involved in lysophospholipase L1 biosynthesis ATPase subunit
MVELNQELGTSLLVATHDPAIAAEWIASFVLEDGRLHD